MYDNRCMKRLWQVLAMRTRSRNARVGGPLSSHTARAEVVGSYPLSRGMFGALLVLLRSFRYVQ